MSMELVLDVFTTAQHAAPPLLAQLAMQLPIESLIQQISASVR